MKNIKKLLCWLGLHRWYITEHKEMIKKADKNSSNPLDKVGMVDHKWFRICLWCQKEDLIGIYRIIE